MAVRFCSLFLLALVAVPHQIVAQDVNNPSGNTAPGANPVDLGSKRVFWIIPNFRTSQFPNPYKPITPEEKFKIATQDSFDRGTFVLAAAFAGESLIANSEPEFGHGLAGYGRYYGTSLANWVIGDYMTEAIFPTLLHQDPRYFEKGRGSAWSRLGYALGQIVITHGDNGRTQFNFSEILGNSTAVAISNAYLPNDRDVKDNVLGLVQQLGVDAASNVLKEFWPDVRRKLIHKHNSQ